MTERIEASTQYNDYKGSIAIDWDAPGGLSKLAEAAEIDHDEYFVFGVDVYIGESGFNQVSFLAIETASVGSTFDAIQKFIDTNGYLPYVRLNSSLTLEDVLKHAKRVSLVALNKFERVGDFRDVTSGE